MLANNWSSIALLQLGTAKLQCCGFLSLFNPASRNLIIRNAFAQLYAEFDTLPLFLSYTLGRKDDVNDYANDVVVIGTSIDYDE